jgi:hypothetical protein
MADIGRAGLGKGTVKSLTESSCVLGADQNEVVRDSTLGTLSNRDLRETWPGHLGGRMRARHAGELDLAIGWAAIWIYSTQSACTPSRVRSK